jgi:hypothetical protein
VVAIAVVLAVIFSGILSSSPGPGSSSAAGSFESFRQADSVGQSVVAGTSGGPWMALLGFGVATPAAVLVPGLNLTGIPSLSKCVVAWANGSAPNVTVPATPASAAAGTAAFWIVGYVNASADLRLAMVSMGNGSLLATVSGTSCTDLLSEANPLPTMPYVDSPVVAENVSAAGAGSWLADHANVTETWEILPGATVGPFLIPASWHAEYTTCSLSPSGPKVGAYFDANLTAATGAVTAHSNGTESCVGSAVGGLAAPLGGPLPISARQTI